MLWWPASARSRRNGRFKRTMCGIALGKRPRRARNGASDEVELDEEIVNLQLPYRARQHERCLQLKPTAMKRFKAPAPLPPSDSRLMMRTVDIIQRGVRNDISLSCADVAIDANEYRTALVASGCSCADVRALRACGGDSSFFLSSDAARRILSQKRPPVRHCCRVRPPGPASRPTTLPSNGTERRRSRGHCAGVFLESDTCSTYAAR
eukprot:4065049-Pleurochrysis_carterae.AAC.1